MTTLGLEMTTLFAFFEIAFGPVNVCQCEMTKNFALYACTTVKNTTTKS